MEFFERGIYSSLRPILFRVKFLACIAIEEWIANCSSLVHLHRECRNIVSLVKAYSFAHQFSMKTVHAGAVRT
ncbi:hypothetical protein SUGI_0761690 [Cryptomeria japonica]|nr:hypothetical protein SUGI_0761690 [Cryptomeria japonica]